MVGLSLQLNWIVKGFSTLVLGHLSDRHGRRPVIIASFLVYIFGTLGCACARTMKVFLMGRVVQGIGEGSASISSAVARDVLEDQRTRMKMLALLGTLRPVAIIAAPSVGGILGAQFGWRNVFLMLSTWGALNLVVACGLLPETLKPPNAAGKTSGSNDRGLVGDLAFGVARVGSDRVSFALVLTLTVIVCAPAAMLSNIAFVLEGYGFTQTRASLFIGSIPATMIAAGCIIMAMGGKAAAPFTVLRTGMVLLLLAAGIGALSATSPGLDGNWVRVMVPCYFLVFAQSLCGPPGMALFLQPWEDDAGLASGVMSLSRASVPAFVAFASTRITDRFGPAGLLLTISAILTTANLVFWPLLGSHDFPAAPLPGPNEPTMEPNRGATSAWDEEGAEDHDGVEMRENENLVPSESADHYFDDYEKK